jgi:predicted ribosome quality control (RQC) complex YloA/Tae2 family protein
MENFFLSALAKELREQLVGRFARRFSGNGSRLAIDFGLSDGRVLIASLNPRWPGLFLSGGSSPRRRPKDPTPGRFVSLLRSRLESAKLVALVKPPLDRVIRLEFADSQGSTLSISLRGPRADAWLADGNGRIEATLTGKEPDVGGVAVSQESEREILEELLAGVEDGDPRLSRLVRQELRARSRVMALEDARHRLVLDMVDRAPIPLIYSRVPLEQLPVASFDLGADLILSHFELVQAEGMRRYNFGSLSEAAERYVAASACVRAFQQDVATVRASLTREIKKQKNALAAMAADIARFDDPDRLKRFGDLLLANLTTAKVTGTKVSVIDYYDPKQPVIEIDIGEAGTLQQAASRFFSLYQKGKRALASTSSRKESLQLRLRALEELMARLEAAPTPRSFSSVRHDAEQLLGITPDSRPEATTRAGTAARRVGRWYRSTDGYEIGVGRNDSENDSMTFRLARSKDIWLHAADYPGSHVLIRNPTRRSVPQQTIIEAAELAAFFSQAKREARAAVNYTEKRFVSKPPRSKPGLARLSSYKTILVEPRCKLERI